MPLSTTSSPRRARTGVSLMFFTNGVLLAALLPRLPELKTALDLSDSEFGLTVVAFPLGAILTAAFAGRAVRAVGARTLTAGGSVLLAAGSWAAGVSEATWVFFALLLLTGALDAVVDAAQNVHGVTVERWMGRSAINSFHALWSLGAATGGAIGAFALAREVPIGTQMLLNGVIFSVVALVASAISRVPDELTAPPRAGAATAGGRPGRHVWALLGPLVLLAICGTLVEDVANNWAVLFFSTHTAAPAAVAGLGLTVVISAQFVGRMVGDRMTDRWGRMAVARTGGLLIAGGMLAVVLGAPYPVAMAGFALMGFGSATLVPAAFAAANAVPGLPAGTGIALLGWLMRIGFLLTSPVVGLVSDAAGLRRAMLLPVAAGIVATVLAVRVGRSVARVEPAGPEARSAGGSAERRQRAHDDVSAPGRR